MISDFVSIISHKLYLTVQFLKYVVRSNDFVGGKVICPEEFLVALGDETPSTASGRTIMSPGTNRSKAKNKADSAIATYG